MTDEAAREARRAKILARIEWAQRQLERLDRGQPLYGPAGGDRRRRLSDEEVARLVAAYREHGTLQKAAAALGISVATVRTTILAHQARTGERVIHRKGPRPLIGRSWTDARVVEIIARYRAGETMQAIGDSLDSPVSREYVRLLIARWEREHGEAKQRNSYGAEIETRACACGCGAVFSTVAGAKQRFASRKCAGRAQTAQACPPEVMAAAVAEILAGAKYVATAKKYGIANYQMLFRHALAAGVPQRRPRAKMREAAE